MIVAELPNKQTWGNNSQQLSFPFGNVLFKGLSYRQSITIRKTYKQFIGNIVSVSTQEGFEIECYAYKLLQAPTISPHKLTIDGQYAPDKTRRSDRIEITGINFQALLSLNSKLSESFIAVFEEHELALANVIENFLRIIAAHRALELGGVVLHSAGLVFAQRAFIFVGHSGAGKTTLTRKAHRQNAKVLSDDINILLPSRKGYEAHAVPFAGEFGRTLIHQDGQESFPVAGIILLQQGSQLLIKKTKPSEAIAKLLAGSPFVNQDEYESKALFDVLVALTSTIPIFRLISRRDDTIEPIMKLVNEKVAECDVDD